MSEAAEKSGELPPILSSAFPLSTMQVGVICVMCCEAVMFASLLIAYLIYKGKSQTGPYAADVLSLPLAMLNTVFLVSSSFTIERAVKAIGHRKQVAEHGSAHGHATPIGKEAAQTVRYWMLVSMGLAFLFLCGTGWEWKNLIYDDGVTIGHNLFGSTYFTLIGCHALHVLVGMVLMGLFAILARRQWLANDSEGPELLAWYWHLVDAVWIVILFVVYIFGR